eukprot:1156077-Pelagomonas_calceolata.AAC.1
MGWQKQNCEHTACSSRVRWGVSASACQAYTSEGRKFRARNEAVPRGACRGGWSLWWYQRRAPGHLGRRAGWAARTPLCVGSLKTFGGCCEFKYNELY